MSITERQQPETEKAETIKNDWVDQVYWDLVCEPLRRAGMIGPAWSLDSLRNCCSLRGAYSGTSNLLLKQSLDYPFDSRFYSVAWGQAGFFPTLAIDILPAYRNKNGLTVKRISDADIDRCVSHWEYKAMASIGALITISKCTNGSLDISLRAGNGVKPRYHYEAGFDEPSFVLELYSGVVVDPSSLGRADVKLATGTCSSRGWAFTNTLALLAEEGYKIASSREMPQFIDVVDSVKSVVDWLVGGGKDSLVIGGMTMISVPAMRQKERVITDKTSY